MDTFRRKKASVENLLLIVTWQWNDKLKMLARPTEKVYVKFYMK